MNIIIMHYVVVIVVISQFTISSLYF